MDTLRAIDPLGTDWVVGLLLLVLGVLAWINMVDPKKWRLLSVSFIGTRLGKQSLRDEWNIQDRTLIGMLAMAAAVIALFAYQFLCLRGWMAPGLGRFAKVFGVVVVVVVAQLLLLRWLVALVRTDGGLSEYLHTVVLFHIVLGMLLIPLVTLMAFPYHPEWRAWLWSVGLLLVVVVAAFRWVRAGIIGIGEGVPVRYIFIYLCTAEILPVALAVEFARHFAPDPSNLL